MYVHSNGSIHSNALASVFVDYEFNRFVRILPSFPATHPHVQRCFVEVNQHFIFLNELGQLKRKVKDCRPLNRQRLLISIVAEQVLNSVPDVEVTEHLPAHFDTFCAI